MCRGAPAVSRGFYFCRCTVASQASERSPKLFRTFRYRSQVDFESSTGLIRVRTHHGSQKKTVSAMQVATKRCGRIDRSE